MSVPFVLNRASSVPLGRQIYEAWRTAVLSGRFHAGDRVPSSRALAEMYHVARITVTGAYEQLRAEGYFEARPGSGTFVASDLPDRMMPPIRRSSAAAGGDRP